jgi:hypothetical protein
MAHTLSDTLAAVLILLCLLEGFLICLLVASRTASSSQAKKLPDHNPEKCPICLSICRSCGEKIAFPEASHPGTCCDCEDRKRGLGRHAPTTYPNWRVR